MPPELVDTIEADADVSGKWLWSAAVEPLLLCLACELDRE